MRRSTGSVSTLAVAVAMLWGANAGHAETLTVICEERDTGKASTLTATYEGEADGSLTGTLKVVGSFGGMTLPATWTDLEADVNGVKIKQTAILADGTVEVMVPAKAALEACIVAKRQPDDTDDHQSLMACRNTVEAEKREVNVHVDIGLHSDSPEPSVFHTFTYLELSKDYQVNGAPKGFITIESSPPPKCKVVQ